MRSAKGKKGGVAGKGGPVGKNLQLRQIRGLIELKNIYKKGLIGTAFQAQKRV